MKIRKTVIGTLCVSVLFFWGAEVKEAAAFSPDTVIIGVETDRKEVQSKSQENNQESDWKLILVNRWHPIPEDYEIAFTELQNDHRVDSRIYPELQAMFDDARAQGILPKISSSYRTAEMQKQMMEDKIVEFQNQGYSYEDAKTLAEQWVAIPGTSEHQIGIAVDITTADWQQQDASVVWDWLNNNCYKYGFIMRYPEDKSEITGVMGEPWHYRYVGKEAAFEIFEKDVCLEEYLLLTSTN